MEGAVLQGVLIDEAMEGRCQRARGLRGSTGAGAISQALAPLVRGLGTAKDPRLFRLFHAGISGREGRIRQVEFEGPPGRALS